MGRCRDEINRRPITPMRGREIQCRPRSCHIKRRLLETEDIICVGVKYFLSVAKVKELSALFGLKENQFTQVVYFALEVLMDRLIDD